MSTTATASSRRMRMQSERAETALSLGFVTTYLTLIVALPIAALLFESTNAARGGSGRSSRARRRSRR